MQTCRYPLLFLFVSGVGKAPDLPNLVYVSACRQHRRIWFICVIQLDAFVLFFTQMFLPRRKRHEEVECTKIMQSYGIKSSKAGKLCPLGTTISYDSLDQQFWTEPHRNPKSQTASVAIQYVGFQLWQLNLDSECNHVMSKRMPEQV